MTDRSATPRIGLLFQIFRTHELSSRLVVRALEPTGVRGDDYAVYSVLLFGPMTLTEVARRTGLPLTTAAGYVQRFEERGHVVKTPNPADGRSKLIALTDETRRWIGEVAQTFSATIDWLDKVMANRGIDANDLIDQLEIVQDLITTTLEELDHA